MNMGFRYVILEDGICYDNDDYGVWGAVLFDTVEDKIVTSKYGHGTDMTERPESVELATVVKNGFDIAHLIDKLIAGLGIGVNTNLLEFSTYCSKENPISLPVKVTGGRKFKGDGYLVYTISEPVRYGWGAYHGATNYKPVVFDPVTKTFNVVNSFSYIEMDCLDELHENIKVAIREAIPNTVTEVYKLAHGYAYGMSYASCDSRNKRDLIESYNVRGLRNYTESIGVADCVIDGFAHEKEAKRIAREKFKSEKMPALIEWVEKNTDKKGADIIALAEHIFNKKY